MADDKLLSLEWFGCTTFRVRVNDLTLFFDTDVDRPPGLPAVGLAARDVSRDRTERDRQREIQRYLRRRQEAAYRDHVHRQSRDGSPRSRQRGRRDCRDRRRAGERERAELA